MSTDVDISAFPGLNFNLVTDAECVIEAVLRRLSTPRGGLFYAPDYGLDLREALLSKLGPNSMYQWKAAIEQEAMRDDRVVSANASLSYNAGAATMDVSLTLNLGSYGTYATALVVSKSGVLIGA